MAESFDEDGNKLADWLGDGALKMNAGTTLNLTGGSIAFFNTADLGGEGSVINVEASRLDINSALDGDFLAEGEAINISNAGKLNLTAATADSEMQSQAEIPACRLPVLARLRLRDRSRLQTMRISLSNPHSMWRKME